MPPGPPGGDTPQEEALLTHQLYSADDRQTKRTAKAVMLMGSRSVALDVGGEVLPVFI